MLNVARLGVAVKKILNTTNYMITRLITEVKYRERLTVCIDLPLHLNSKYLYINSLCAFKTDEGLLHLYDVDPCKLEANTAIFMLKITLA